MELDPSQRAVLELPADASAVVLGAPGSGKTTTLVEAVAQRVLEHGWSTDDLLVLAPSRATATRLRDRLALRLGVPTSGPLARTPTSFAFRITRSDEFGDPPTLLTGGEQDAFIRELLEGHAEEGTGPVWPDHLGPDVRALRAFRTELRELLMRATEYGVTPERLAALGREHDRPEWVAAGAFAREYAAVLASTGAAALDPAELLSAAAASIRAGADLGALRLVLLDDAQEVTESVLTLVRALAERGIAVLAFGDPDVATNGFRGGEASGLSRLAARTLTLDGVHRHGPALRAALSAVVARVGAAAAGTQRAAASRAADHARPIAVVEAPTPARQYAAIARRLREEHLENGCAWTDMVVVVRSGARLAEVARALTLAEVPARGSGGGRALRDDTAARTLLTIAAVALGRTELDEQVASDLLLSPFGGLDRLGLRTLRLALRAEELAGGGSRPSGELLVEALADPARLATIDHRVGRSATRLAGTLQAVAALAGRGGTIEELLWTAWERSRLAERWGEEALSAGVTAEEANRNLDGVLALFTSARRFVERRPEDEPRAFVDSLLDAEVPEDLLTPQAREDAVLVTTPSGVVGSEYRVVVVADVQEGVWPNLRLRGSLLGAQQLVRVVTGEADAQLDERRLVRDDELRLFALAISRARERVIVGAVVNDDEAPSVLFGLLPPEVERLDATAVRPLSLRATVGRMRRDLTAPGVPAAVRAAAASGLALLAREQVPGAAPEQWGGLLPVSTDAPLWDLDDPEVRVPVSPSSIDRLEEAPLHWFVDRVAGDSGSTALTLGNVLHWALETSQAPDADALWARVEERWGELVFESPWVAERERRLARRMVEAMAAYLADTAAAGNRFVSAEQSFELEIDRAVVRGKIDRVEQADDGRVVIIDLKTGQAKKADGDAQLEAYQAAYASGVVEGLADGHAPGGAALLFVKKGNKSRPYTLAVQPPFGEEGLAAFTERITRAAQLIAAAEFEGLLELDEFRPGNEKFRWHIVGAVTGD